MEIVFFPFDGAGLILLSELIIVDDRYLKYYQNDLK